MVDNLICTMEAASLNLAIKVGIKMWAKGTLRGMLNLIFTFP